jgi:hypothetical protein
VQTLQDQDTWQTCAINATAPTQLLGLAEALNVSVEDLLAWGPAERQVIADK